MSREYLKLSPGLKHFREVVAKLPPEKQRYKYFAEMEVEGRHPLNEAYIERDGDTLIFIDKHYRARFNKSIFLLPTHKSGFKFDGKKLQLWWGLKPTMLQIDLYKAIGCEWVTNENIHTWMTKGLLERILKRKVTNPTDACKYIISSLRLPKTTSPEQLRTYIKNNGAKPEMLRFSMVAKDVNSVLDPTILLGGGLLHDLIRQANILGRKIDFKWSGRRLNEVHDEWTKEIMALELETLEEQVLPYGDVTLPDNVKLLRTRKEVFQEGTLMKHCIYTNYWYKVEIGEYLVLHVTDPEGDYTVGLVYGSVDDWGLDDGEEFTEVHSWRVQQAFTKGNKINKFSEASELLQPYLKAIGDMMVAAKPKFNSEPHSTEVSTDLPF